MENSVNQITMNSDFNYHADMQRGVLSTRCIPYEKVANDHSSLLKNRNSFIKSGARIGNSKENAVNPSCQWGQLYHDWSVFTRYNQKPTPIDILHYFSDKKKGERSHTYTLQSPLWNDNVAYLVYSLKIQVGRISCRRMHGGFRRGHSCRNRQWKHSFPEVLSGGWASAIHQQPSYQPDAIIQEFNNAAFQ